MQLLDRMNKDLVDYAVIEQYPKFEGRQIVMVLGPKKKGQQ
jgi:translation initiation factor IF-3